MDSQTLIITFTPLWIPSFVDMLVLMVWWWMFVQWWWYNEWRWRWSDTYVRCCWPADRWLQCCLV